MKPWIPLRSIQATLLNLTATTEAYEGSTKPTRNKPETKNRLTRRLSSQGPRALRAGRRSVSSRMLGVLLVYREQVAKGTGLLWARTDTA